VCVRVGTVLEKGLLSMDDKDLTTYDMGREEPRPSMSLNRTHMHMGENHGVYTNRH
jgi:hypothetical protein